MSTVGVEPLVIPVPAVPLLGGIVNFFTVIEDYLCIRKLMSTSSDRFFMATKSRASSTDPKDFFTKQHVGKNKFGEIVGSVCSRLGIVGDGPRENVTTHGLRATMISLLVEANYDDSTIALRSGYRNLDSLKRYHNLRGSVGLEQRGKMLKYEQVQPAKRRKEESEVASTEEALPVKKESKC